MANYYQEIIRKLDDLVKSRFVEMFDSYPVKTPIGDCLKEIKKGQWGTDPLMDGTDCYVIKTNNMEYDGTIHYEDAVPRHIEISKYTPNVLRRGDVLVEKSGGTKDHPVGYSCIYLSDTQAVANSFILVLSPTEKVDPLFIQYQLRFMYERGEFSDCYNKTTGIQNLIVKRYLSKQICCPPLAIQQSFAEFVKLVNKSKDIARKAAEKYDQLIKSRFIEMFNELEWCPLSEYVSGLSAGKSLAGSEDCINKVLNTGSVTFGYFNPDDVKNLPKSYIPNPDHLVKKGDLLISRMNTPALVGASAYVNVDVKNTYLPDRLWRVLYNEHVDPIFLWQALQSKRTMSEIASIATGTSGTMKNISKEKMLKVHVPKAALTLQKEFSNFWIQVDKSKFLLFDSIKNILNHD